MKCEWENMPNSGDNNITKRLRVPGGWIMFNQSFSVGYFDDKRNSESMVFVPDPNGEWKICI